MNAYFKFVLITCLVIAGLLLPDDLLNIGPSGKDNSSNVSNELPKTRPAEKDYSRLEMENGSAQGADNQSGKAGGQWTPRTKDKSRLELAGTPDGVADNKISRSICERLPCACDPDQDCGRVDYNARPGWLRPEAMAVEGVLLAQSSCGIELTELAHSMIAVDKAATAHPFTDERAVLANLWRETFACNPEFAGENCFAARWQMCQRAYAEYGPDGIRVKGLIKAIVKK